MQVTATSYFCTEHIHISSNDVSCGKLLDRHPRCQRPCVGQKMAPEKSRKAEKPLVRPTQALSERLPVYIALQVPVLKIVDVTEREPQFDLIKQDRSNLGAIFMNFGELGSSGYRADARAHYWDRARNGSNGSRRRFGKRGQPAMDRMGSGGLGLGSTRGSSPLADDSDRSSSKFPVSHLSHDTSISVSTTRCRVGTASHPSGRMSPPRSSPGSNGDFGATSAGTTNEVFSHMCVACP